jgi:flagellar M-ring protein FliF
MAERAKAILKRLLDIWNKYTSKQKTLIISAVCIVVFAFALLIFLMQRKDYEVLTTAESTKDAGTIVSLLQDQGIAYKVGSDHLTISVESKSLSDAVFLLEVMICLPQA